MLNFTDNAIWFHLAVLWQLARDCFRVSPCLGLGNSSTRQTTITTEYANSFNTSDSYATSFTGGNSSLTIGSASQNLVESLLPLLLAALVGLGGLWLLTRKG